MAEDPKKLMTMPEDDLIFYALSGNTNSYAHLIGSTALQLRHLKAQGLHLKAQEEHLRTESAQTAALIQANEDLVHHTRDLANKTNRLVLATWGVVAITLITQVALIILTLNKP